MSLTALKRPACHRCQYNLIQSFAAVAGISLPPFPRPSSPIRAPPLSRKWYTQSHNRLSDHFPNAARTPASEAQDEHASQAPADAPSSPSTSIPWYLQVDVPTPPAPLHPLAERQAIPELPEDPPTILSPILQYLSIEAGLDNLSLIDLRYLNPPPALGANLLMIIGTARSVKHLNVSADRFCRWLRSNYKMRPYADGLLGRNELKLKLRRKARRLKLAQSVGNTLEAAKDDGITTGWICVNLGSVEGLGEAISVGEDGDLHQPTATSKKETQEDVESNDDGYIGFGSRSTAPRIVVQMFIEEKRAEMDLEGLWEARMTRRAAKGEKLDTAADTKAASKANNEALPMQRRQLDQDGDIMVAGEGYDLPRPFYAVSAS